MSEQYSRVPLRLEEMPDLLTVSEAAELLRISRSTAYTLANRFVTTGHGLPAIRIGRTLRCPRSEVMRLCDPRSLA